MPSSLVAGGESAPDQDPPPPPPPPPPRPYPSLSSALPFWFYLTASVSLLALLLPHLLSPSPPPLPPLLHSHAADGTLLKLHPFPDLFAITSRPADSVASVLILPGLAAGSFSFRHVLPSLSGGGGGILAAALDLPGQGMSPPVTAATPPPVTNPFREILTRGVFHAFEHLVQTGEVPYQSPPAASSSPEAPSPPSIYSPASAADSVAAAVDALGLPTPLHLVLHETALAAGAAFVSSNPTAVGSITLIDSTAVLPAFPAAILGVPVLGTLVIRVPALFRGLLRLCCARGMGAEAAEAYRAAVRMEKGKREAVFESWKGLNQSFDLKEWRGSSEAVRRLPMMVIWSGAWSDRWIDEGKKVVAALPDAKFVYHSGGRWPQEDAYDEISKLIAEFVTSLPTSVQSQHIDQSSEQATAQE